MRWFLIGLIAMAMIGAPKASAQVDATVIANEICDCFIRQAKPVRELIEICYLEIFDAKTIEIKEEAVLDSINTRVVKHLSRTCKPVIMDPNGQSPNASMRPVENDRESLLSQKQCDEFTNGKSLYYIESWGDTTSLSVTESKWAEAFPDGTYSKLKFKWTGSCQFQLEFIESNHYLKKNGSATGDLFDYKIIDHQSHKKYFLLHAYLGDFIVEATLRYH